LVPVLMGGIEAYFGSVAKISAATQVVATLECAAQVSAAATRMQRSRLSGSRQTRRAHRARSRRVPRCRPGYGVRAASTPGRSRRGRDPLDLPALRERALDFAVVRLSRPLSDEQGTDDLNVELSFPRPTRRGGNPVCRPAAISQVGIVVNVWAATASARAKFV
jgi:hypothetical protein